MSKLSTLPAPLSRSDKTWGRVLICGGTDWPRLGKKDKGGKKGQEDGSANTSPDLLEPHILRSLSNIKAASIHTSCVSCYCIVIDVDGAAWMFGRNDKSCLGLTDVDAISENEPRRVTAQDLGAPKGTRLVTAGCGKSHTLLVGSEGQLWSAGANQAGQCGHPACPQISTFKLVNGPKLGGVKEKVVQAAAGITFSVVLTESGKVFAFGSEEKGQLANGQAGERIVSAGKSAFDYETEPILVRGLVERKIVKIACGSQHAIALDSEGRVYGWGYNGYCRLGLGNQQDALVPKLIPQFAGPNELTMAADIAAGPSNSVVIDKQNMYYMAGKWKNTGDGSGGQPFSTFKLIQDIMGCKIVHAACGGVTHWAIAQEEEGVMTITFGQGALNGELGLGPNEPKSSTKPLQHKPLTGIDVLQIAAGQNTSYILAHPNDKYSDLPRHPAEIDVPDFCFVCETDNGDDDPLLECEKCDYPFHLKCLSPPLDAVPDGEWFCPDCEADPGAPVRLDGVKRILPKGKKGKATDFDEELAVAGQKRKASSQAAPTKRKK
ncbi:RCC1/BLIP-II [Trametes versicolor FP-101664 SS1]|uniref:RCC1/BLIP-II n=1 Tax=Trametes versicolor (strain FP-101664) TaxID=717944 RepID=UPI000462355E|nr:RCC1/BLIP-II [Trametes versicolor FP-101664 SS1]EIW58162.1 RCC1/BLIP-II [Trametes versicolor FP-101664 SS1]